MRFRNIIIGLIVLALLAVPLTGIAYAQAGAPAATARPVPGGMGITLPPGYTLGPYGKVMPANQTPTVVPRAVYNITGPNAPGGTGITVPPGYTLGPYGKVMPANQSPTIGPTPTMTASATPVPTARPR